MALSDKEQKELLDKIRKIEIRTQVKQTQKTMGGLLSRIGKKLGVS